MPPGCSDIEVQLAAGAHRRKRARTEREGLERAGRGWQVRVHTDGSAHVQEGGERERERAGRGRQVRVLTDAHALCQRKLDAVIAGQTM